jgi:hypothetical protein
VLKRTRGTAIEDAADMDFSWNFSIAHDLGRRVDIWKLNSVEFEDYHPESDQPQK